MLTKALITYPDS